MEDAIMCEELDNLMSLHLTPVYRLAIQLAPTLEDAADLTMLTFIAASRSSHEDEIAAHGPRIGLMRGAIRIFRSRRWGCGNGVVAGDGQARFVRPLGSHANPRQCDGPLDFG